MTKYQGGKQQIGAIIAKYINAYIEDNNIYKYAEPFMGMGGVMKHINPDIQRYGFDINGDVTMMWYEYLKGIWFPFTNVNLKTYNYYKYEVASPSADRGFVGSACSFGGMFFNSYGRTVGRNMALSGAKGLEKIKPFMKTVIVRKESTNYLSLDFARGNFVIYADPPYGDVAGYSITKRVFDSALFWNRVLQWSDDGNSIFVSYNLIPPHSVPKQRYRLIWKKQVQRTVCASIKKIKSTRSQSEYLFFFEPRK